MVWHVCVVFGQFVLLVLLTLLSSERKCYIKKKKKIVLHCSKASMPRIPNNVWWLACLMLACRLNTLQGMLGIRFRTTGSTHILPGRGHLRVTMRGQDRYIMNTHLCNRFETATATAANTPGLHNNRISVQTVCNCLWENGLHARLYVRCILMQHHHLNWTRVLTHWIWRHWSNILFLDESRFSLQRGDGRVRVYRRRNERVADCRVLEWDLFGGGGVSIMVWAAIAHGYHSPPVITDGNLNAQRNRHDILAHHVIPLYRKNVNIRFFSMVMPHLIQLETLNFLRQITLISLMTGPLTVLISTPSSMSGIVWTDDWGIAPTYPLTLTNFVKCSVRNGTIFHRQKSTL